MEEELLKKVRRRRIRLVVILTVIAVFAGSTAWALFSRQAAEDKAAGTEPVETADIAQENEQEEAVQEQAQEKEQTEQAKKEAEQKATEAKTEKEKKEKEKKESGAKAKKEAEEKAVQEAAAVDEQIAAIGQVELKKESKKKIKAARTAYEDLSDEAKAKVELLDVLAAAEKDYKYLKEEKKAREKAEKEAEEKAEAEKAESQKQTVTISINCSELSNHMDKLEDEGLAKYVPENGVILGKTKYRFTGRATVYDALKKVCRDHGIHYIQETGAGYAGVYISSINHLAEFDGGKNSGWMYKVNGTPPNITCSQYELSDGDNIKWFYTINYKKE